mgnify:CR=1 FL=1
MQLPFFIARRYLFARKSHNVINIISAISAIGMAVGTAALIIILSVYNGFDALVKDTLGSVEPDILISPTKGKVFSPTDSTVAPAIDWAYTSESVSTMCSILEETVFVSYGQTQSVATVKGVDKVYEEESPIADRILEGEFSLHMGELPRALVGSSLSYKLGLSPRFLTKLEFYYPDRTKNISISNPMASIGTISMRPSATFGINAEVDEKLIIIPLESMRELLGYEDEVSGIEIRLNPGSTERDIKTAIKELSSRLDKDSFRVSDRYHQNQALYKMMRYEKAAIFIILIFIIIIIGFNIFGSLSMLIIEKKGDIATLESMGASPILVRRIFILEGWMITLLGLAAGLVIGIGFALIQQNFGLIKMPGSFSVPAYPVIIELSDIILTIVGVAIVGYIIALLPSGSVHQHRQYS